MSAVIGVDVGTGSARAGVFDLTGKLLASHKQDILMWREAEDIAEQSSDDIWQSVCACVRSAVTTSRIDPQEVRGIGFDAACSLVVLDRNMQPLTVSASQDPQRNVIVWMDHRAADQAARINQTGHAVLDFVGGRISPEMQTPKLLWLKEKLADSFDMAGQFFDLPDFLTWAATGSLQRSACTVTCKWTYLAHESRWDDSYFQDIGLPEMPGENYARIGQMVVPPGTALASGLTVQAAEQLGLPVGTAVGSALIDAHAGGIGTVGAVPEAEAEAEPEEQILPEERMAYVFGTSACTMATSARPHKVPGVWGPYFSAMVPGMWLSEGGQSAAGEAVAYLISAHPMSRTAAADAEKRGLSLQHYLLKEVEARIERPQDAVYLAGAKVIVPDLLGNRAPFADPAATGVMSGISLSQDLDDLLALYVAAVLGVGYGLRQIMEVQSQHGVCPNCVVISGGAAESVTVQQLLADASGYPVSSTMSPEPVLLGAAILGAVACEGYASIGEAMRQMAKIKRTLKPGSGDIQRRHEVRYQAFKSLQNADRTLREAL